MPSQSLEAPQQDRSSLKHKKKPVRRDKEKRRQQNIQAQKKYRKCLSSVTNTLVSQMREKQRQRLETLEAIAASARQNHAIERPSQSTNPSELPTHNCSSNSLDHGISKPLSSFGIGNSPPISSPPASTPGEWQLQLPPSNTTHSLPPSPTWDSCTLVGSSFLIHDKTRQGSSPYWTKTIDCGCLTPHVRLRTRDPYSNNDMQVISFSADGVAADPYMSNVIRIERVCIATALYTLMKYVGIEEGIFCADDSPSPFYRPGLEIADDAMRDRTIGMVQQMFKTLKPDLRPIAEQITVEHHPYIDILPFPTLRRNLIIHQNEIDEDEFLNDTLTGLVCWGGAGTTKRDPDSVTGHAVTGNLWDVRSWEAKVWFLKKYWWLLGGEEGELVRQSEWWQSVRGEEA
ncbi:uncharacterized protein TRIVIDRAFT_127331, partial [Trichoderma virens Gv29-8]